MTTALQYRWARHPLAASFGFQGWRRFVRYGGEVSVGNVANWLSMSIDRLLIARSAPAVDIGYYNTMLNLMSTPVHQVSTSLNTVAFSVSAQSGEAALRRGTVIYLHASTLLFGMLYGVFAAAPHFWVGLIYGPRWIDGAVYLTPFCVAAVGFGLAAAANAVLTSGGRAGASAVSQVATAVLIAAVVASLVQDSAVWAAWGVAAVYLLRALALGWLSLRRVGAGGRVLVKVVIVPLLFVAAQVACARALVASLAGMTLAPALADIIGVAGGLAVVIVPHFLFRTMLLPQPSQEWLAALWHKLNRRRERPTS